MRLILPESNAQRKTRPRSSNRGVRSCGRMVVSVKTAAALSVYEEGENSVEAGADVWYNFT